MKLKRLLKFLIGVELDPFLGSDWHGLFQRSPIIVYDIGASGELFSPYHLEASKVLKFYGFEPEQVQFQKLEEKYRGREYIELRQVAICDKDGPVTFFRCTDSPSLSSVYDRDGYGKAHEAVEIEGVRLDTIPQRFNFPAADFVKMDTEGNELMILCSGSNMLSNNILGVWTEFTFWRNPGDQGTLFHEIDKLMNKAGFILFDMQVNRGQFSRVGGKKGKMRSGDALYLCDFSAYYHRNCERIENNEMRNKLFKLVSLCVTTGYLDYAIEILDFGSDKGLVDKTEFKKLASQFVATTDISELLPDFPGRLNLALMCDVFSSMLHMYSKKGIPRSSNRIGNDWPFTVRRRQPPDIIHCNNAVFGGDESGNKSIKLP